MRVVDMKALTKECGLRDYSKLRKTELIILFQNNFQPIPAPQSRPQHPTRPPPPPPQPAGLASTGLPASQHPPALLSVRFRPDRPGKPELLRQLEERNPQLLASQNSRPKSITTLKPYQLKPKRGQETFIEPPVEQKEVPSTSNTEQIKSMKKKLGKLNKKIRHYKKKHNSLVSK